MAKIIIILLTYIVLMSSPAWARLKMDDRASLWPSATATDKIDFTNRMGKAMSALDPDLDSRYFMKCLEETANVGDTKELTLNDMVRTCVSLHTQPGQDLE